MIPEGPAIPEGAGGVDAAVSDTVGQPQASASAPSLVAWPMSDREATADGAPASVAVVSPRSAAIATILLGFPAGVGLTALSWRALRRTDRALVQLALGAAFIVGLSLLDVGRAAVVLNAVAAVIVWGWSKGAQAEATRRQLTPVGLSGRQVIVAMIGGWAIAIAANVAIVTAIDLAAEPAVKPGEVAFGTRGEGCS